LEFSGEGRAERSEGRAERSEGRTESAATTG